LKWSVPVTLKTNGFQTAGWLNTRKPFLNSDTAALPSVVFGAAEAQPAGTAAATASAAIAAKRSGTDRTPMH
jgi:hypothetical protein